MSAINKWNWPQKIPWQPALSFWHCVWRKRGRNIYKALRLCTLNSLGYHLDTVLFIYHVQGTRSWQTSTGSLCGCNNQGLQILEDIATSRIRLLVSISRREVKGQGVFSHNLQHFPLLKLLKRKQRREHTTWNEAIDRREWFIHAEFTPLCFDPEHQICCWSREPEAAGDFKSAVFPRVQIM